MNVEKLKDILCRKCTIGEAIDFFCENTKASEYNNEDIFQEFNDSQLILKLAYSKLVELGEIDTTKIFNTASSSFDGEHHVGDIGFCDDRIYLYVDTWMPLFKTNN